jgi:hypothetical protein
LTNRRESPTLSFRFALPLPQSVVRHNLCKT